MPRKTVPSTFRYANRKLIPICRGKKTPRLGNWEYGNEMFTFRFCLVSGRFTLRFKIFRHRKWLKTAKRNGQGNNIVMRKKNKSFKTAIWWDLILHVTVVTNSKGSRVETNIFQFVSEL